MLRSGRRRSIFCSVAIGAEEGVQSDALLSTFMLIVNHVIRKET